MTTPPPGSVQSAGSVPLPQEGIDAAALDAAMAAYWAVPIPPKPDATASRSYVSAAIVAYLAVRPAEPPEASRADPG